MILRGAVLSDDRVSLELQQRGRAAPEFARTPLEHLQTERTAPEPPPTAPSGPGGPELATVGIHSSLGLYMSLEAPPPPPPMPVLASIEEPGPLTLDAVMEWLSTCDATARAAIIDRVAEDIDALREAARVQGETAGRAAGTARATAECEAECEKALSLLAGVTAAAEAAFEREIEQLADQCANVAVTALCKIGGPLLAAPEATLATVLEVLRRVKEEREVVIRVAAPDLPVLRAAEDRIARSLAGRRFSLVADDRVVAGGCIVESKLGSLDGRLDLQLRALGETIRAAKVSSLEQP